MGGKGGNLPCPAAGTIGSGGMEGAGMLEGAGMQRAALLPWLFQPGGTKAAPRGDSVGPPVPRVTYAVAAARPPRRGCGGRGRRGVPG